MCGDGADSGRTESDTFPFLRRRGPVALIGMSTAVATPPTFATGRLGRPAAARARGAARRPGGREPLPRPPAAPSAGRDHDRLSPAAGRRRRSRGSPASIGRSSWSCAATSTSSSSAGCARNGSSIPVVGAPSASLHGGDRHHEGGYIIYDLEHAPGRLEHRSRAAALRSRHRPLCARCSSAACRPAGARPAIRLEAPG